MRRSRKSNTLKLFRVSVLSKKIDSQACYTPHAVKTVHAAPKHSDCISRYNITIDTFDSTVLTYNQLEACRKIVARCMRRHKAISTYLTCLKFTLPITAKSKNSRMGKGKGGVAAYVASVNKFDTIFILRNVTLSCASGILCKIAYKLPISLCLSIRSATRYHFSSVHS